VAEAVFVPKPGQVDYTNIRYCPVVNCILQYEGKVLLVQRSKELRLYPSYWNGISGFLDDAMSVEEKVYEELKEELHLSSGQVADIHRGEVFVQEAPEYHKTWIVFPVRVEVTSDHLKLDWEAEKHKWVTLADVHSLDLLPGCDQVLAALFPSFEKPFTD
jgi:ADP-ribose pyrophosphatase YjhB (NUDIX family)